MQVSRAGRLSGMPCSSAAPVWAAMQQRCTVPQQARRGTAGLPQAGWGTPCWRAHCWRAIADISLGIYLVRGENLVLLGQLDPDKEKPPGLREVSGRAAVTTPQQRQGAAGAHPAQAMARRTGRPAGGECRLRGCARGRGRQARVNPSQHQSVALWVAGAAARARMPASRAGQRNMGQGADPQCWALPSQRPPPPRRPPPGDRVRDPAGGQSRKGGQPVERHHAGAHGLPGPGVSLQAAGAAGAAAWRRRQGMPPATAMGAQAC